MNDSLGIPKNLTEMGVKADNIDELSVMAMADPSVGGNPVEMTLENTKELFKACM